MLARTRTSAARRRRTRRRAAAPAASAGPTGSACRRCVRDQRRPCSSRSTCAWMFASTSGNVPGDLAERRDRARRSRRCCARRSRASPRPRSDRCRSRCSVAPGHRLTAAIDRMPEPQPTSSTRSGATPASASACSSSSTSRVLACVPVPNAMPGSRSITTSSGCGGVRLPARHDHELAGQPADLEVALPRVAPLGLGHRGRPCARAPDRRAAPPAAQRATASRVSASALATSAASTQNTISSPRCSVPAAAAATSDAISAATSSTSAAPTGTMISTQSQPRSTQTQASEAEPE